jgi:hypothetical protein
MPTCSICENPLPGNPGPGRPRLYHAGTCANRAKRQRMSQLAKLGLAVEKAARELELL